MNSLRKSRSYIDTFLFSAILLVVTFMVGCGGGGGSTASTPTPPSTPPTSPSDVTTIALTAKQLVYDTTRQRLYASVWGTDANHPNTVAVINPSTGAIDSTIAVGSNPNQLALSKDGKYLYVGIDGTGSVSRIDLATGTVGLTFSLGTDSGTMLQAESITVLPVDSSTCAVTLTTGAGLTTPDQVKIFDAGVQRPNVLTGTDAWSDQIAFSDSGDTLYGAELFVSAFSLHRYSVGPGGLGAGDSIMDVFANYGDSMIYASGRIYTRSGRIFDPAAGSLVGVFPVDSPGSLAVDTGTGGAYFITSDLGGGYSIHAYDLRTFLETGQLTIATNSTVSYSRLVKLGSNGFGYIAQSLYPETTSVVINKKSLSGVSAADPTLDKLPVNHIVYDPTRNRIYASVPSSAGSRGNSIAVIDPKTSMITNFIPVGSDPNPLALSEGATYLFVGLDGGAAVARLNLSTQSVEQTFSFTNDQYYGMRKAVSIAAVPGSPKSFAAATHWIAQFSPIEAGDFVVDDNVQRPNVMDERLGSDVLAFGSSPNLLYGFDYFNGFQRINVDPSGISLGQQSTGLILSYPVQLQVHGNLVFASDGTVLDPSQMRSAGLYAIGENRGMVLDDTTNGAYFLADDRAANTGYSALFAFDQTTLVYRGKMVVPAPWQQGFDLTSCGNGCFAYATSPGVTILAANFAAATAPTTTNLPVNHLLYDAGRNKIYASVSGAVAGLGNSVVTIDPVNQSIDGAIHVGSEPNPMAISSDGSRLYVGLDGSAMVAEVDLTAKSVTGSTWMGQDSFYGPLYAYYLSVSPNDPEVVAVTRRRSRGWSPLSNGVSILDHGSLLNKHTDNVFQTMDSIAYGPGESIYAYNNEDTGFNLYRLLNDGSGVSVVDSQESLIYGFSANIQYNSGMVYSSNGYVVDPVADTTAGTFAGANFGLSLAIDNAKSKAYFLNYDLYNSASSILGFDKQSLIALGAKLIPGHTRQGYDLILHTAGFTYATADGHIIFTNPTFAAPVDLPLNQLPANRVVYDALRQRIYAAIPSRGGLRGNSIAIINPATSAVESSVPIGSEPGPLALSADWQYLYVGLQGAGYVKRINLATQQVDLQFTLGTDSMGPKFAADIAVMPGDSGVVAVAKMYTTLIPPKAGIGIFDHGVERTNSIPSYQSSDSIAFSSSATLYGYVNDETTYALDQMPVDSNGVTLQSTTGGLISGHAQIQIDSGLIYSTVGTVVDPVNKVVAGTFAGVGVANAMVVDDKLGRVFFLTYDSASKTASIAAFDKSSYQKIGTQTVTGSTAEGTGLARWGGSGFAVSTRNEIIVIPSSTLAE